MRDRKEVPREPTPIMMQACIEQCLRPEDGNRVVANIWRAMYDAAPRADRASQGKLSYPEIPDNFFDTHVTQEMIVPCKATKEMCASVDGHGVDLLSAAAIWGTMCKTAPATVGPVDQEAEDAINALRSLLRACEAEREALRTALKKYGKHSYVCFASQCLCGLDAALAIGYESGHAGKISATGKK